MSRFRNYRNKYSKKNRIYSMEELLKMSLGDFFDREDEIDYQDSLIGLPTNDELKHSPNVKLYDSYTDENGQNYPARWESFLPTQAETMVNMENSKNQFASRPVDTNFTELDNYTKERIAKLNNKHNPQQTNPDQTDFNEFEEFEQTPDNMEDITPLQTEDDTPQLTSDSNTSNNDSLSQLLNSFAQLLKTSNLNESPKEPTEFILGESVEPKFYQIDPNEQKIVNYAVKPSVDKTQQQETTEQKKQSTQPQISSNLTDYINNLLVSQHSKDLNNSEINKLQNNNRNDGNITLHGSISNNSSSNADNDILLKSGGYVTPNKTTRNYKLIDTSAIFLNNKMNKENPDAKQMLEIGIYGVDSYEDNDQFKHIKNGSADIFNEKYNLTGNKTIPSDMKGIEFSKDSDFSKRISENEDFQQTVKDAIDKNGGNLPEKIELDFSKDSNLNRSIGHGTLLNAHITDDGYIEGVVFDKYDYEMKTKYKDYKKDILLNTANNGAAILHEWNKLEYYYYFVPVRFKY